MIDSMLFLIERVQCVCLIVAVRVVKIWKILKKSHEMTMSEFFLN